MKTQAEIQRAHDILISVIVGDVLNPLNPTKKFDGSTADERVLMETAATLCWVLEHDHNPTFGKNLDFINQRLEVLGYKLERRQN